MIYHDIKYRTSFINLNAFINSIVIVKYVSRLAELNLLKSEKRTHKDLKIIFLHTLLSELFKLIDKENGKINNSKWLYFNKLEKINLPEILNFSDEERAAFFRGFESRLNRHIPLPRIIAQKPFDAFVLGVSKDVGEDLEQFLHPKRVVSIQEQSKKYEEYGLFYLSNKIKEITTKSSIQ